MKFKKKLFLRFMSGILFVHHTMIGCDISVEQICRRLQKIFIRLSDCINHNDELGICFVEASNYLSLRPYCHFTNLDIIKCQMNIIETKSVIPLIQLWHKENTLMLFKKDELFLREFLILVYKASGEMMVNSLTHEENEHMRDIISQILTVYQKIDSLPLEEILNAIDVLADEMPYLLEKYELTSSMTWKNWFAKYWWAPPLILGTIAFKIWFQNRMRLHRLQLSENAMNNKGLNRINY
jgi:hypothetical protein